MSMARVIQAILPYVTIRCMRPSDMEGSRLVGPCQKYPTISCFLFFFFQLLFVDSFTVFISVEFQEVAFVFLLVDCEGAFFQEDVL